MELDKNSMKFLISCKDPFDSHKFYGKNASSNSKVLFSDNSMQKIIKKRLKFLKLQEEIPEKQALLSIQLEKVVDAKRFKEIREKYDTIIEKGKENYYLRKEQDRKAAICIQKNVRGYLARLYFNSLFIDHYEKKLYILTKSLKYTADRCFFYKGTKNIQVNSI